MIIITAKRNIRLGILILFFINTSNLLADNDLKGLKYVLNCSECHGFDGNSNYSQWPNIAGLNEKYIIKQLLDFKSGLRKNKEMDEVIQTIPSDKQLHELAVYFASQKVINSNNKKQILSNPVVKLKLGEEIYTGKRIDYGIPACSACHGIDGMGDKEGKYPKLYGQHNAYIIKQMKLFRSKERSNDNPAMMRNISMMMDDEDIESVAAYIITLTKQPKVKN